MINKLEHQYKHVAQQILDVQLPAYRVEAECIGFYGIPALKDDVYTIIHSKETFIGYIAEGKRVVGIISYEENNDNIEICRLVVHPAYFRRGIARQLLAYILNHVELDKGISVSTGAKNNPALHLYQGFGFSKYAETEVDEGVHLVHLERKGKGTRNDNI